MSLAGLNPDPWQQAILRSSCSRLLLTCSRQAGKSTVAAGLAIREALLHPPALILLLSPTQRQSGEIFRAHFSRYYRALGEPVPVVRRTELTMELANGSRIVALPENEEGIRCYSNVRLLVIDEASRVSDALYNAVTPMLAVSNGTLIAMSTPFGRRGWFWEEWSGESASQNGEDALPWERVKITAEQCPRIPAAFLRSERRRKGQRWYDQEYCCSFEAAVGAVFDPLDIDAMLADDVAPLVLGRHEPQPERKRQ